MSEKPLISVQQIKAARALLDWKQSDLADSCGLSLTAVNNLERGIGSPRVETVDAIRKALEQGGIEFLAGEGVKKRGEASEIKIFEGARFLTEMNDYILPFLKEGGEVLLCGIDERKFTAYGKEEVRRLDDFVHDHKIAERIIIRENDTYVLSDPKFYRWVPEGLIGKAPFLIFGDVLAVIMWDHKKIVCVRSSTLAGQFRLQFEFLWGLGRRLPGTVKRALGHDDFQDS